jgi:hypothetical protein
MYEVWYSNAVNTDGGISPYSDETKSWICGVFFFLENEEFRNYIGYSFGQANA